MERGLDHLKRRARRGSTAIEYALLAVLMGAGIIVAFQQLGQSVQTVFEDVEEEVSNATGS
jgi:Flp pilus assembly pilin Flp